MPVQPAARARTRSPRADQLPHHDRGRGGNRQRHHVGQRAQIGGDLLRGRVGFAEARDEQRHEGVRGHIDQERTANRQAEFDDLPLRVPVDRVRPRENPIAVKYRRQPHPEQRRAQHQPGFHRQRPGAADAAQGGNAADQRHAGEARHRCCTIHQQPVERHLDRQTQKLNHHHRARLRDRGGKTVEHTKQKHCRCRPHQRAQVAAHIARNVIAHAGESEKRIRVVEQQLADHGHQQGSPYALAHVMRDGVMAAGAKVLCGDRCQRNQHPHQGDENRKVDR